MPIRWMLKYRCRQDASVRGVSHSYCKTRKEARDEFRRVFPGRVLIRIYPMI